MLTINKQVETWRIAQWVYGLSLTLKIDSNNLYRDWVPFMQFHLLMFVHIWSNLLILLFLPYFQVAKEERAQLFRELEEHEYLENSKHTDSQSNYTYNQRKTVHAMLKAQIHANIDRAYMLKNQEAEFTQQVPIKCSLCHLHLIICIVCNGNIKYPSAVGSD